jgi:hypothetical protein
MTEQSGIRRVQGSIDGLRADWVNVRLVACVECESSVYRNDAEQVRSIRRTPPSHTPAPTTCATFANRAMGAGKAVTV